MNWKEYCKETKRTRSSVVDFEFDVQHAALGIFTEAGELMDVYKKHLAYNVPWDMPNILEEIGDMFWYIVLMCDSFGISDPCLDYGKASKELNKRSKISDFIVEAAVLSGHIIRELNDPINPVSCKGYKKHLDGVSYRLNHLKYSLMCLSYAIGKSPEEAMDVNVKKLKARYENNWTKEEALNRDLKTERKILEGKDTEVVRCSRCGEEPITDVTFTIHPNVEDKPSILITSHTGCDACLDLRVNVSRLAYEEDFLGTIVDDLRCESMLKWIDLAKEKGAICT